MSHERAGALSVTNDQRARFDWRASVIVVVYVLGFFGLLPLTLLRFGANVDAALGLAPISAPWGRSIGLPLFLLGALLLARSTLELWQRGHGLPISHLPPTRLVVSGWFARLRHPIYVGYSLAFAGAGSLLGSFGISLVASAVLLAAWCSYAAFLEEPMLLLRFGESYRAHIARTRRLPHAPLLSRIFARAWDHLRNPCERVANRPVWFTLGHGLWVGYGVLVAIGAALAAALAVVLFAGVLPAARMYEYVIGLALSMLVGGRSAWLVYERQALFTRPLDTLRRVGFVSFGAYLAMVVFASLWARLRAPELGALWFLDRTMLACLVCSGFGRIGCLSYGCCYGKPWQHGMCFSHPHSKVQRERGTAHGAVPRAPTQVLSALLAFASAALLALLLVQGAPRGFASLFTALCYALIRFDIEGLRDEPRFFRERLTRGQVLAALIALSALLALAFVPFGARSEFEFVNQLRPGALVDFALLPILAAAPVLIVCGYHRRHVGSW